ncbi:MAG: gamma-glutamylcyclotransferase family protein [Pleurocapsa sp.]
MAFIDRTNFVFGYGSLVNVKNLEQYLKRQLKQNNDYTICSLYNFQRCWNVAMDNKVDLPEYKYYRDRFTNKRINGFVTFLNIRPYSDRIISGILFRVSHKELRKLDLRERNYQRIDITNQLNIQVQNAWVYIGSQEAKQRYQKGLSQGKAVIAQDYYNSVENAYRSLGEKQWANYIATTDKPSLPITDLEVYPTNL